MPKHSRTQCSHHWGHLFCWKLCIKIQFSLYRSRWQTANWPINTCCIRSCCSGHVLYSLAILWSARVCKFESKAGVRRGSESTVGKRKWCCSNPWRWKKSQGRQGIALNLFARSSYASISLHCLHWGNWFTLAVQSHEFCCQILFLIPLAEMATYREETLPSHCLRHM